MSAQEIRQLKAEMDFIAEATTHHDIPCLCSDCYRFCEIADVLITSGAMFAEAELAGGC